MKLTKRLVKAFEQEQARWGTHTALFNILWAHARENLADIGVTRVRTEHKDGTEANKRQTGKQKARKIGRNGASLGRGRAQEPVRQSR